MNDIEKFKLSPNAISYLKGIMNEMGLTPPVNGDMFDKIIRYVVVNYETGLLDDDYDLPRIGFEKEHKKATDFVSEITGQWNDDESVPDFDDINTRLT